MMKLQHLSIALVAALSFSRADASVPLAADASAREGLSITARTIQLERDESRLLSPHGQINVEGSLEGQLGSSLAVTYPTAWGNDTSILAAGAGTVSIRNNGGIALASTEGIGQVTVVPEPETYAMFLAGLGMLGAAARRKKQAWSSSAANEKRERVLNPRSRFYSAAHSLIRPILG